MAEDGSKLWLRYVPLGNDYAQRVRAMMRQVFIESDSPTMKAIRDEINLAMTGMTGATPTIGPVVDGALVIGTLEDSATIRSLNWDDELAKNGLEGFVIRSTTVAGHPATVIASLGEIGALYGTFHLLRVMQTGEPIERLAISRRPRVGLRLLNHWDNIDGSIERGYAGRSLWNWDELPGKVSRRCIDYARANASIGINGAVLNNVNANVRFIRGDMVRKITAIADAWRPYGIRVFLSANFSAPIPLANLPNADPHDPSVASWWVANAAEIYSVIPDFGGYLVKANSEGQPGPQDYGRTHADGANALADAVAPHKGVVIWRAFVYNESVDPDRAKRAYIEFMALDGKFRPNAIVQVKNGPIDFQPREPFHPLFGAMKQTPVIAELQATQEYLGQSKHLVYLATMWKEFLDSDTYAAGEGSTVARTLDGSIHPQKLAGMVAVANTGSDVNWCGHDFAQANWYAFGRLAWDHDLPAQHIADEWVRMTFTSDPQAVEIIREMMMSSHETFVSYTMPLGLHHLIGGDHYAPMPWNDRAQRPDWTATYYHHADASGIGFDRTRKGDKAVEQYFKPVADVFDDPAKCPERLLLWFHHLPWNYKMKSGQTLWKELCDKYYAGHAQVVAMQATWMSLKDKIDPDRHKAVADRLAIQVADSMNWRDRILEYFSRFSGMAIEK